MVSAIPTDGYRRPGEFGRDADMVALGATPMPRVNVLAFDNVALAVIPGEMFNTFGEMMHAQSPLEHLLLVGYGAAGFGYVPPVVGYEQGGYETRGAVAQGTRGLDIARKVTEYPRPAGNVGRSKGRKAGKWRGAGAGRQVRQAPLKEADTE